MRDQPFVVSATISDGPSELINLGGLSKSSYNNETQRHEAKILMEASCRDSQYRDSITSVSFVTEFTFLIPEQ